MRGKLILYVDQYGAKIWARTVKELHEKSGGGRVFKIYADHDKGQHAGRTVHCGYGVGQRWFNAFVPLSIPQ